MVRVEDAASRRASERVEEGKGMAVCLVVVCILVADPPACVLF